MDVILNGILPVCALIALGKALRRFEMTNDVFLKTADRLIYACHLHFPGLGHILPRNGSWIWQPIDIKD